VIIPLLSPSGAGSTPGAQRPYRGDNPPADPDIVTDHSAVDAPLSHAHSMKMSSLRNNTAFIIAQGVWIHQICGDTGVTVTKALPLAEDRPFWWMIAMAGGFGNWLNASCHNDADNKA